MTTTIEDPAFMRTLPRKAQRRLPKDHTLTVAEVTGRSGMKRTVISIVRCTCGWESQPLGPRETAEAATWDAMRQHLSEEALNL
jgi:hypothetical protein